MLTGPDKERLLEDAGISTLYSLDFAQVRDWQAEDFVRRVLFGACNARRLCCGEDFRFGKGAAGNVALLRSLCQEAGVELYVVPPVEDGGEKVSSTRIRKAVEAGDIPTANRLLGRPLRLLPGGDSRQPHRHGAGHAHHQPGHSRGLCAAPVRGVRQLVPGGGAVLLRRDQRGGKAHGGLGQGAGRNLDARVFRRFVRQAGRVFLLEFLRPERKFASLEELKAAITYNGRQAQAVAARTPPPAFPASRG